MTSRCTKFAMRDGNTVTSAKASEAPSLHTTLEALPDTETIFNVTCRVRRTKATHEFAITSTYCPGTK